MTHTPPLYSLQNFSKSFGNTPLLHRQSLDIWPGEWLTLMGASGSGKSTLMNILGLLDSPTTGTVTFEGRDITTCSPQERQRIRRERLGLVFQQFHLVPYLTALENVMLAQHLHSTADKREAADALTAVGLGHRLKHLPATLSGGERQRVCIARALTNGPALLLADEPTGNLDQEAERVVMGLFEEAHSKGTTVVLITHNPQLVKAGHRCLRLENGVLRPAGP